MDTAFLFLTLSGVLTVLMWTPYIAARLFVWGPLTFLGNYPENFPAEEPTPPLWAQRAKRAHLNMVETMPAFIAVVLGANYLAGDAVGPIVGLWAQVFFFSRIAHFVVYTLGVPAVRTPIYLVSWASILLIAKEVLI